VKTYYYGCSAYIRHGRSQCSFGAILQKDLEGEVIRRVLEAYAPYLEKGGKERLVKETRESLGKTWEQGIAARERAEAELRDIEEKTANLLDSLSPVNREHVDGRLQELDRKKTATVRRIEELSLLDAGRSDVESRIAETWLFLATLEATLVDGNPDQRRSAIRRGVEAVTVVGATLKGLQVMVKSPLPDVVAMGPGTARGLNSPRNDRLEIQRPR